MTCVLTSKKGTQFTVRPPNIGDLHALLLYINELSEERTYVRFQGEKVSLKEEQKYLEDQLQKISEKTAVLLLAFYRDELIGVSGIEMSDKTEKHVGVFSLSVRKKYREEGIGFALMQATIDEGIRTIPSLEIISLGVFARNIEGVQLYKKYGFIEYGTLPAGSKVQGMPTDLIFMYKTVGNRPPRKITRIGVYGVAKKDHEILLVIQERGPYAGKFDLPGGGIEFAEAPEDTLHREFLEEVGMDFDSMTQIDNLSATIEVPEKGELSPYTFHQIGLIYSVRGLGPSERGEPGLRHAWVDIRTLHKEKVSPFVWAIMQKEVDNPRSMENNT